MILIKKSVYRLPNKIYGSDSNIKHRLSITAKGNNYDEENWAVVELQGDIRSHSGEITGNQLLGDLHFTKDGTPVLIIGHHLLYGKETKFEKPLAVMEKYQTIDDGIEYRVKAIITKKLLFRTRPKPIIV